MGHIQERTFGKYAPIIQAKRRSNADQWSNKPKKNLNSAALPLIP